MLAVCGESDLCVKCVRDLFLCLCECECVCVGGYVFACLRVKADVCVCVCVCVFVCARMCLSFRFYPVCRMFV